MLATDSDPGSQAVNGRPKNGWETSQDTITEGLWLEKSCGRPRPTLRKERGVCICDERLMKTEQLAEQ